MEYTKIKNRRDLAEWLGIPLSELTYVLYVKGIDSYYSSFSIPKKDGSDRIIEASQGSLKYIQRKLAFQLQQRQKNIWEEKGIQPNISHAFQKGKSIITNASVHKNKHIVVKVDLKDFFHSFHFGRVKGFFEKSSAFAVDPSIAIIIAQLTCYKGRLPQGAPSSPIVTDLICNIMDMRILSLAKEYRVDYTRYADDLTFSTNDRRFIEQESSFMIDLEKEVKRAGFELNQEKTIIQYHNSRQIVTGLVVNEKVSVKRDYYKKTRAMASHLYNDGLFYINGEPGTIQELEGRFSFINQIDQWNNKHKKEPSRALSAREKEYKKFLIYKYFYCSEKPVLITEGKTDNRYISAALKNRKDDYPNLIQLNHHGDESWFNYEYYIFQPTKRINFFFDYCGGGGDSFMKILDLYYDNNREINYIEWFKNHTNAKPKNPVILVYDNEHTKKRPLVKAINRVYGDKTVSEILNGLDDTGFINLKDNLYILTMPKKVDKDIEIEDLFNDFELKMIRIDGRTYIKHFEKNPDYREEKHFSKNAFSLYVDSNYKNIDFSGFKPFLDALSSIVDDYRK